MRPWISIWARVWRPIHPENLWCECPRWWAKFKPLDEVVRYLAKTWHWHGQCQKSKWDPTDRFKICCHRWAGHFGDHLEVGWHDNKITRWTYEGSLSIEPLDPKLPMGFVENGSCEVSRND